VKIKQFFMEIADIFLSNHPYQREFMGNLLPKGEICYTIAPCDILDM